MATPKVSVIVPVFNVKTYLRECLDSILAQTLSEIEVICGDGGSTDGSLEIIQEYAQKDTRVRYITKERSGYGQSVNECMDMANGEYIGIVESDDAIEPNTYEVLYGLAHQNDLDWIRGDIYYYYSGMPEDQQLKRESIIYGGDFYNVVLNPQTDYRPYKSGLRTWSGIYKTAFLRGHNIQHNETPGGSYQDVGFYLKTLYYAKRVYFVDQAFYKWRQDNPGSSVHYNSAKLVEKSLNEWHLNQQYLDEHPNIGSRAKASYHYRKFFSYLWTIDMAVGEDKLTVQKLAAEEFSKALENGEIDKGFFEEWEWERFINELNKWKELADHDASAEDTGKQPEAPSKSGSSVKPANHSVKQLVKKLLRPFARVAKKVTYKLMGNVMFSLENDLASLRLRVNETAEDTQWQVRESAAELRQLLQETKELNGQLRADIAYHRTLCQRLEQQLEFLSGSNKNILDAIERGNSNTFSDMKAALTGAEQNLLSQLETVKTSQADATQKLTDQSDVMRSVKTCSEDIRDTVADMKQKVLDQGDVLRSVKSRSEDIHDKVADMRQKVLDQGDVLWNAKARGEDIYDAVSLTKQKVLDQGDVLWSIRDKVKDIETFDRHSADALMWNMLFELKREDMQELIGSSPMYDSAFYWNNRYGSITSAQHILSVLFQMLPHRSVVDFGCGTGTWLWVAKTLGAETVFGLDGEYVPHALLLIDPQDFLPVDLEKPVILDRKFDLALSMEVAEHLSETAADAFIDSLCASADTILFSAAHPGQGGDGHINEQPREYWIEKFMSHNFKLEEIKQRFCDDMKIELWYRENMMLFRRER